MEEQSNHNPENKTTAIIAIILIMIVIIFFSVYALSNNNLSAISKEISLSSSEINDSDNYYYHSYLGEGYEDDMISGNFSGTEEVNKEDDKYKSVKNDNIIGYTEPITQKEVNIDSLKEKVINDKKNDISSSEKKALEEKNSSKEEKKEKDYQTKVSNPLIYPVSSTDNDKHINDNSPYTIQIATHNKLKSAEHIRDVLLLKGYNAYILEISLNGKLKYRIRVGVFETKDDAIKTRLDIIKTSNIKGVEDSAILYKKKN